MVVQLWTTAFEPNEDIFGSRHDKAHDFVGLDFIGLNIICADASHFIPSGGGMFVGFRALGMNTERPTH